jgi:hypothetical protein
MTSSSYTSEPFRNMPLGDWLATRVAQHDPLATSEALATRWLAAKPLKTMKRDDYKGECIERFGISGRAYQFLVWPVARKLAGLTMRAAPGPKKQIKK